MQEIIHARTENDAIESPCNTKVITQFVWSIMHSFDITYNLIQKWDHMYSALNEIFFHLVLSLSASYSFLNQIKALND